ncbi:MAG: Uncharacterized conserved protein UCP005852, methanogenesis [Candidatus Syntrophoarchaeum caldarius]|uniref:Uncharacterized conserved protein UCP005852, methanogenesis n=1 Tax=Candidatus Syntropharchaeum caldarium TaxID=1838285 RepID=A0A1F2PBF6_9EURY|nr:MAG: Uncharacterized conserved protein UCP005852, methanogenesis [Candidatus Syntrophoarchaeum caldarius]
MRSIKLNGTIISEEELDRVTTVKSLVEKFEPIFDPDMLVVERKGEIEARTDKYTFTTTKGKFQARMREKWHPIYEAWIGKKVEIIGKNAVIFSPVRLDSDTKYSAASIRLKRGDIFLFRIGSGDPETYLGIARTEHEDRLFLPPDPDDAVIGRVIGGGRTILQDLVIDDVIKEIAPEYAIESLLDRLSLTDVVEDGMEIYTSIALELSEMAPCSAESFLAYLRNNNGFLTVDEVSNSYIRSVSPPIFEIGVENNRTFRDRGMAFLRNDGDRKNSIYFYKKLRMPQHYMNAFGTVRSGIELIDVARLGDKIAVHTNPVQVFLVGMSQYEAEKLLEEIGITHIRKGEEADDAIIVSQQPDMTIEIFKQGKVETEAIAPDNLLRVELFEEEAPETVHYFKDVTGLYRNHRVGKLVVTGAIESLILFRGGDRRVMIKPENTPAEDVGFERGVIGVTNMSRPHEGTIGIRLIDDPVFGPTGEIAASTNVIGRVVSGLEILDGVRKGDVYFLDVTPARNS